MSQTTAHQYASNDALLAQAMRDLENDLLDLRDMASIMEAIIEQTIEGTAVVDKNGDRIVTLNEYQVRRLVFVAYDVERRSRQLSDKYQNSFTVARRPVCSGDCGVQNAS